MTMLSYNDIRKRFPAVLEKVLIEGQVKFSGEDGQVFVIRPEQPPKTSPFDIHSLTLSLTRADILDAIHESRSRF